MTRLDPQSGDIPLPPASPISQPFWDGCEKGLLRFQRCRDCGKPSFNPAHICRFCLSRHLDWEVSGGLGSIYSWTVAWRAQSPAFSTPYAPVIVELDEGFQMISNLVNCEAEEIDVGMRVRVLFHPLASRTLPYFEPAGEDRL